jgi:regulation of enolase protein 1 (concanavalin A-like superfamily)
MASSSSNLNEDDRNADASSANQVVISGFGNIVVPHEGNSPQPGVLSSLGPKLALLWYAAPDSWQIMEGRDEGRGGSWKACSVERNEKLNVGLVLYPPSKKDFWRKTFYEPVLVKDDGPFLYAELDGDQWYTVETSFVLHAQSQFDQAGIMIRIDHEHWIKAGIEVVDRLPRLSCVVTNSYSDWSTQPWPSYRTSNTAERQQDEQADKGGTIFEVVVPARIRVHCRNASFVVEACMGANQKWEFIRICHLSRHLVTALQADPLTSHPQIASAWQGPSPDPSTNRFWAGVFAACPQQAGARVVFEEFSIIAGSRFDHNAEGNQE